MATTNVQQIESNNFPDLYLLDEISETLTNSMRFSSIIYRKQKKKKNIGTVA